MNHIYQKVPAKFGFVGFLLVWRKQLELVKSCYRSLKALPDYIITVISFRKYLRIYRNTDAIFIKVEMVWL